MPPIRMVVLPVWANLTGTTEPTDRCLVLAVVVSMSSSPAARAGAPVPESIRRMTVSGRWSVETAVRLDTELWTSNWPL